MFSFIFFRLPDDIWLVDLDSNKLTPAHLGAEEIPPLPEPEGTILKNHLKQVSPQRPLACKVQSKHLSCQSVSIDTKKKK